MSHVTPFINSPQDYQRDIDPIKLALTQYSTFLHISTGKPLQECRDFVLRSFKPGGKFQFKDPKMRYLERGDNGDRVDKEGGTYAYIRDSINKREIIAPTLTTYMHPDDKPSILSEFIEENVAKRNVAKKEMYSAETNKDEVTRIMKSTEQKLYKLANNSISGMHCNPGNPLFNKTAHSTLTSNCRSTSGYGNANNEKFLLGNRHYYNHHIVMNNIISIINNFDEALLESVMQKYNLTYPSVEQTVQCIEYSTNLYWWETHYFSKITNLVMRLSPLQRAAFVYIGDFYHLRKFNEDFCRKFLDRLIQIPVGKVDNPLEIIKNADETYVMFAHQVCADGVKGHGKKYKDMPPNVVNDLALVLINTENTFDEYRDLIRALWVTTNIPASVAYFPTSIRRSALTSDTDSTIFTVQDWILWHRGYYTMDSKAIALIGAMTALASLTIIHVLAIMSANFGIVKKHIHRIRMKNEYRFDVFVPTQLGKHYYANIGCTEGNVYEKHKMEVKGVYLKSSTLPKSISNKAMAMMKQITDEVMTIDIGNQTPISILKYLKEVADLERSIIASIKNNETVYLKGQNINSPDSYKKDETESPYKQHTFWNEVFGEKYLMMAEPPYRTVKISCTVDKASDFKRWVNSIEDESIKTKLLAWATKTGQVRYVSFNLPMQAIRSFGIPAEIKMIIDYKKIVVDLCSIFYIILETLGFYTYGERTQKLVSDYY